MRPVRDLPFRSVKISHPWIHYSKSLGVMRSLRREQEEGRTQVPLKADVGFGRSDASDAHRSNDEHMIFIRAVPLKAAKDVGHDLSK